MSTVKVYGASDDLIEIESKELGSDEFYRNDDKSRFITFSDGTVLSIDYSGTWNITLVEKGAAEVSIEKNKGADSDDYSDVATVVGVESYKVTKRKLPAKRAGSTEKFIIVELEDCGDLSKSVFDSREEADEYLEDSENKAYLIVTSGEVKIEDHT